VPTVKTELSIVVKHPVGLHARPAALFVQAAMKHASAIRVNNVTSGSEPVDAKSILGVLTLGVMQDHEIHIEAVGEDSEQAVDELKALIQGNFGE
jgi:phosphotransferase system HPr (HPr) family protein